MPHDDVRCPVGGSDWYVQFKAVVKSTSPAQAARPTAGATAIACPRPHPPPRTQYRAPLLRAGWRPCRPRPTTRALAALADHHHRGRHRYGPHCQRPPPPLSAPLSPPTVGPADRCSRRRRTRGGERDKSTTVARISTAGRTTTYNCRGRGVCQPARAGAWGIVSSVLRAPIPPGREYRS